MEMVARPDSWDGPTSDELTRVAELRVGEVLRGKWHLDRLLGVGGWAAVYAATHRNGSRVAVKVLHPELSSDAATRKRFLREGYVANQIGHRGAVWVLDDDVTPDGRVFLVMELLEGETAMRRWERNGKRMAPGEALLIADQALDVLAAAHDKGIVHRDITPANLFLTHDGLVKLLDFGIARLIDLSRRSLITRTGLMLGTPAFMSPEQARARWRMVDERSDLWAVGATLHTLLSGRYVHQAATINEELLAAMTERVRPIASVDSSVPPVVAALVDRALAFERGERWPNAPAMQRAVREAYRQVMGHSIQDAPPLVAPGGGGDRSVPANARVPSLPRVSRSRRALWALGGAALAGGLVFAVFAGVRRERARAEAARTPAGQKVAPPEAPRAQPASAATEAAIQAAPPEPGEASDRTQPVPAISSQTSKRPRAHKPRKHHLVTPDPSEPRTPSLRASEDDLLNRQR